MWQRKQTIYLIIVIMLCIIAGLTALYPILQCFAGVAAGFAAIAIFRYKNRPQQMTLCKAGIGALVIYIAYFVYQYYFTDGDIKALRLTDLLAPLSIIIYILAIMGIRHDENLVRSMDRIR